MLQSKKLMAGSTADMPFSPAQLKCIVNGALREVISTHLVVKRSCGHNEAHIRRNRLRMGKIQFS